MPGPRSKRKRTEGEVEAPRPDAGDQRDAAATALNPELVPETATQGRTPGSNAANADSTSQSTATTSTTNNPNPTTARRDSQAPGGNSGGGNESGAAQRTEEGSKNDLKMAASADDDEGNDQSVTGTEATSRGNTPTGPLHEQSSAVQQPQSTQRNTKNIANTSNSSPTNNGDTTPSASSDPAAYSASREQRIRDLLRHRKLLLERVQQGKSAAQQRLDQLKKEEPDFQNETGEEERARFLAKAREIGSQARKHSRGADGDGTEKRTSVSLRRGSSVGKRMNAALSSLAPGSAAAAAAVGVQGNISPDLIAQGATAPVVSASGPLGLTQSTSLLPNASASSSMVAKSAVQRSASVPAAALGQVSETTQTKKAGIHSASVGLGRPGGQKSLGRQMSSAQLPTAANRLVSQQQQQLQQPNHLKPGSPQRPAALMVHSNILGIPMRRPVPPVVAVPEAVALRERKQMLESKLLAITKNRAMSDPSQPPLTRHSHHFARQGAAAPSRLPKRRKTHWDNLLEEMRWMATDFIEERKWKMDATQSLSKAIRLDAENRLLSAVQSKSTSDDTNREENQGEDQINIADSSPGEPVAPTKKAGKGKHVSSDLKQFDESEVVNREKDQMLARGVAQRAATIVGDFWKSSLDNAEEMRNDPTTDGDENQKASDDKQESGEPTQATDTPEKVEQEGSEKVSSAKSISDAIHKDREKRHREYAEITKKFEEQLSGIQSIREKGSKMKSFGVDLLPEQASGVWFTEEIWKKNEVGSLVAGPSSSGKTFAICSILWKNRSNGPQLVVCSPSSFVKWVDELSYFDGIIIRGVPQGEDDSLEPTSVIVCSYNDLASISKDHLMGVRTMILDSRYPVGFRGSRPKLSLDVFENGHHSLLSHAAPREIASVDWWEKVVGCIVESNAKRILIDPFSSDELLGLFDGLTDRAVLEHLALRMGFLFGRSVFPEEWKGYKKNILGWARSFIKGAKESTGSKFLRVRQLFSETLDKVTYQLSTNHDLKPEIEIMGCKMTASQRSVYQLCCRDVKASLSRDLDDFGDDFVDFPFRAAADALMQLRKLCSHENVEGALASLPNVSRLITTKSGAASQPNASLADKILSGSGKLKELVNILVKEAEVELNDEVADSLDTKFEKPEESAADDDDDNDEDEDGKSKIAILAVLPEVQYLISVLLGALGIGHEVLLETPMNSDALSSSNWLATQLILSRFNDKVTDSSELVNIIVSSPMVVAGNHGGLGVESADFVILVDDDWSGRGELVMRSLISRVTFGKEEIESRFIRLVSSRSCEEEFVKAKMVSESVETSNPLLLPWPVTSFGYFTAPRGLRPRQQRIVNQHWNSTSFIDGIFLFPGSSLVSLSNKELSHVLGMGENFHQVFGSKERALFMPSKAKTMTVTSQSRLLRTLLKVEEESTSFMISDAFDGHFVKCTLPPVSNDFLSGFWIKNMQKLSVASYAYRKGPAVENPATPEDFAVKLNQSHNSSQRNFQAPGSRIGDDRTAVDIQENDYEDDALPDDAFNEGLLVYDNGIKRTRSSPTTVIHRNSFASAYRFSCTGLHFKDGAQGSEMLVYFPPLFPRLRESAIIAKESVEAIRGSTATRKRDLLPDPQLMSSKRLKVSDDEYVDACVTTLPPAIVTEDEATKSDAASVLLDLTDDYGLVGIGAIPLPRDSALCAGQIAYNSTSQDQLDSSSRSDSTILFITRRHHPAQFSINMMPGQMRTSNIGASWSSKGGAGGQRTLVASNGTTFGTMNGDLDSLKASKKPDDGATGLMTPTTGAQAPVGARGVPQGQSHTIQMSKVKDVHRTRLIAASRQSGTGTTLFETTPFRAAAVRIRNKVEYRLSRHCWTSSTAFEVGPGLPLHVSKPQSRSPGFRGQFDVDPTLWTSVVKRLKNSSASTGDEAMEVSLVQRGALRRSLAAPTRVDFGPFNAGFLSAPGGMTAISPPRPILGVTLPMGVKLPQTSKDQAVPWTSKEEEILKATTLRFGTNWTLVSRILTGLEDVVTVSRQPQVARQTPRAAKTSREHWQQLARADPTLAREVKKRERAQREKSTLSFSESPDEPKTSFELVQPASNAALKDLPTLMKFSIASSESDMEIEKDAASEAPRKLVFSAIAAARKKTQKAPIPIPGQNTDGPVVVAPIHPSHMQAVQNSISSTWTKGRTEMWPLQFLDAADRYRAQQQPLQQSSIPPHSAGVSSRHQSKSLATSRSSAASGSAPSSVSASRQKPPPQHPSSQTRPASASYPRQGSRSNHTTTPAASSAQSFAPPTNQQIKSPAATSTPQPTATPPSNQSPAAPPSANKK